MEFGSEVSHGGNGYKHPVTATALLITIGIVFGDIGTSPLYVMKTILGVGWLEAKADYITGAVSCIIWTLTLQTTLKYVVIALRADKKGEGGILALYSLIKHLKHRWLYVAAAVGAAMLIADGVITPAITVTSAIEGLHAIDPDTPVMPIVLVIITVVFGVQRFGTSVIGKFFGPFMFLWFLMLGLVGIAGIAHHHYILRAFNPYYAWRLLVDYPGWVFILGAVFLCTTGAEALYSDLGHCGRKNITISWIYVKAMLILNYLGQGAWIIDNLGRIHPGANPFYTIMPSWLLIPGIVMATGAAIIASQALISGSFSIFSEAMNLNLWPRILIKYPARVKGQLYIPSVNFALYIGCVVTVLLFQSSSHMEAAYGLAITITMIITTVLLAVYMHQRKVSTWIVAIFAACFGIIEGSFLVANMFKFMNGGWYTLLIAGFIVSVMVIWYNAIRIRSKYILMRDLEPELDLIAAIKNDDTVPKTASNLIFLSKSLIPGKVESKLLYSIINKGPKRADHYFLLRMEFTDDADTLDYSVSTLIKDTFYDITIRIGYRVSPRINVYLRDIVDDLVTSGEINMISAYPSLKKHGIVGNFKFVIIRRVFSPSSSCGFWERFVMLRYELLRHLGTGYEKIFGLDTSIVDVERVPLIITNKSLRRIRRVE